MDCYFENLDEEIKDYFKVLSPTGVPEFLYDFPYINSTDVEKSF